MIAIESVCMVFLYTQSHDGSTNDRIGYRDALPVRKAPVSDGALCVLMGYPDPKVVSGKEITGGHDKRDFT